MLDGTDAGDGRTTVADNCRFEHFAQWLFTQVHEGADEPADTLSELRQFVRWFLRAIAGQLGGGRSQSRYSDYEDD